MTRYDLSSLSDSHLMTSLHEVVATDRRTTAALLAHLGEVDRRHLYADEAFSSMFDYCVRRLNMSEGTAYKRIGAARAAGQYPLILEKVAGGELHTTGIELLAPRLTQDNHAELLAAAANKSKRQIQEMLAARFP